MKWILITLLIGVIMIIAYSLSEQYKEKFDFYSNLKNFLNQFKINLSFRREKISEFLKQVNSKKQFKIFTDEYMNYLSKGELNLSKIKALDSEDIPILEDIVKNIGKHDSKNEISQIDSFLVTVSDRLTKAEADKNKLCPMIIKLSLLFAIGVAILLI